MIEFWQGALGDLSKEEIMRGMDRCMREKYAPNLPTFRQWCRPRELPEEMFYRAMAIMQREPRDWSGNRVLFHAVIRFGQFDLRYATWEKHRVRWTIALEEAMELEKQGKLEDPPKSVAALPSPDDRLTDLQRIERLGTLREISERLAAKWKLE